MNAPPIPTAAQPLEAARRRIEASGDEVLSLADLAREAGLSPYHFCRQFSARYGCGPIAYLRARRLAVASQRLRGPSPPPLVELAFDSGFETQEGFTRAFVRAFGVPPGRYRSLGSPPQETTPMTMLASRPDLTPLSAPMLRPALRIAGLRGDFDDDTKARIPLLWTRLFARWPEGLGRRTFGVCSCPPGSDGAELRYLAGVELAPGEAAPPGLDVIELPARTYVVAVQTMDGGPLHPQMQAGMKTIWGELLPASGVRLASGAPDLEVYPEGFAPDRAGERIEWWIPVEP